MFSQNVGDEFGVVGDRLYEQSGCSSGTIGFCDTQILSKSCDDVDLAKDACLKKCVEELPKTWHTIEKLFDKISYGSSAKYGQQNIETKNDPHYRSKQTPPSTYDFPRYSHNE